MTETMFNYKISDELSDKLTEEKISLEEDYRQREVDEFMPINVPSLPRLLLYVFIRFYKEKQSGR